MKHRRFFVLCFILLAVCSFPFGTKIRAQSPEEALSANSTVLLRFLEDQHNNVPAATKAATDRHGLILDLAKTDPRTIKRYVLPDTVRSGLPKSMQSSLEKPMHVRGTLEVLHHDTVNPKGFTNRYYLQTGQNRYTVYGLETYALAQIATATLDISGTLIGEDLIADSSTIVSGPVTTQSINKSWGIILVKFLNDTYTVQSKDQVIQQAYLNSNSAKKFYEEDSYGQWTITSGPADVYGWYTVDPAAVGCDGWQKAGLSAASKDGFSGYTNTVYVLGSSRCGYGGEAKVNSSIVTIYGYVSSDLIVHELGHNYGLDHANSRTCSDAFGTPIPWGGMCSGSEYGDYYDVMGMPYRHFSVFNKNKIGFLTSPGLLTVTQSGTYTLVPQEFPSAGTKGVVIPPSSRTGEYLFLEYRQPYGSIDNFPDNSPATKGILFRTGPDPTKLGNSWLYDMHPSTKSALDHALFLNETVLYPYEGISFTTTAVSSGSASVRITFGQPVCVRGVPKVAINPIAHWALPGEPKTYQVTITNTDTAPCAGANIYIYGIVPSGWTINQPPTVFPVSAASSASFTATVTSPVSAVAGTYTFTEKAVHSQDSTLLSQTSANYNISSSPPVTPTPTVQAPKPGDANGDNKVDEADYGIWLAHFTQTIPGGAGIGDFNADGKVDGIDFCIWTTHYGS